MITSRRENREFLAWTERHAARQETDEETQLRLMRGSLLRVLSALTETRRAPGTAIDIMRLLHDGLWRTRAMINAALGVTTAGLYLPSLAACGQVDVVKVQRTYWYRGTVR